MWQGDQVCVMKQGALGVPRLPLCYVPHKCYSQSTQAMHGGSTREHLLYSAKMPYASLFILSYLDIAPPGACCSG